MPFQKGQSGNPGGRINEAKHLLRLAIETATKKHKQGPIEKFVELAYEDKQCLIELMRKILPDMTETDIGDNAQEIIRAIIEKAADAQG